MGLDWELSLGLRFPLQETKPELFSLQRESLQEKKIPLTQSHIASSFTRSLKMIKLTEKIKLTLPDRRPWQCTAPSPKGDTTRNLKMQSLREYRLLCMTKLKECAFRQQLLVTYLFCYRANCYSDQTIQKRRKRVSMPVQNHWHNLSFNGPSIWFLFIITDSQRHPCTPHLSLEEKKNPFLNWFALCHCHRYVFPVLTGSCNSISSPSTSLWNRSVLG